jgi:hypothetical protein
MRHAASLGESLETSDTLLLSHTETAHQNILFRGVYITTSYHDICFNAVLSSGHLISESMSNFTCQHSANASGLPLASH